MEPDKTPTHFHLKEENSTFSSRSKDIFGSLDKIEKKHDEKQKQLDEEPESRKEQRSLWKEDPKVESISSNKSDFKTPFRRPPTSRGSKFRRVGNKAPDYRLHPDKWTKYSLEDVQTSESSNTRAAFAFLDERRKLREAEEMKKTPEEEDADGKIVFKKPSKVCGGVNKFSSRKSKNAKLDKVNINHLGADDNGDGIEELTEKRDSGTEPPSTFGTDQGSGISFKKGSRKRNIRVRGDDDGDG